MLDDEKLPERHSGKRMRAQGWHKNDRDRVRALAQAQEARDNLHIALARLQDHEDWSPSKSKVVGLAAEAREATVMLEAKTRARETALMLETTRDSTGAPRELHAGQQTVRGGLTLWREKPKLRFDTPKDPPAQKRPRRAFVEYGSGSSSDDNHSDRFAKLRRTRTSPAPTLSRTRTKPTKRQRSQGGDEEAETQSDGERDAATQSDVEGETIALREAVQGAVETHEGLSEGLARVASWFGRLQSAVAPLQYWRRGPGIMDMGPQPWQGKTALAVRALRRQRQTTVDLGPNPRRGGGPVSRRQRLATVDLEPEPRQRSATVG